MRFFLSSAAHGVIGNGYPRPATSPKVESGVPSGVVVGGGGAPSPRPRPPPPPPARIQIPEKSTLPSAVRGVGASRFGLPSAVRGTPGVGYEGHCAPSVDVTAMRMANTPAIHSLLVTKYEAPEKRRRPVYPLGLSVGSVSAAVVSSDYFWVPRSQARGGTHAALRTARRRGKPRFRDPTT